VRVAKRFGAAQHRLHRGGLFQAPRDGALGSREAFFEAAEDDRIAFHLGDASRAEKERGPVDLRAVEEPHRPGRLPR
jgi:hypothetical protein